MSLLCCWIGNYWSKYFAKLTIVSTWMGLLWVISFSKPVSACAKDAQVKIPNHSGVLKGINMNLSIWKQNNISSIHPFKGMSSEIHLKWILNSLGSWRLKQIRNRSKVILAKHKSLISSFPTNLVIYDHLKCPAPERAGIQLHLYIINSNSI